jgi:16S rRNA (uracil1498-N3)-methyltransferase
MGLALLKGRKIDRMIRMLTEIGVMAIYSFTCERSVPRLEEKRSQKRLERWRSIAVQASRQSGRTLVPSIHPLCSMTEILNAEPQGARFILHEKAGLALGGVLATCPSKKRFCLVGPEGGFSAKEVQQAEMAGFCAARLDLPILQAQTAALVVAAFVCDGSRGGDMVKSCV